MKLLSPTQFDRYERLLRRLRQRIFDYTGEKETQASRLIAKVKAKLAPNWQARADEVQSRQSERLLHRWA